MFDCASYQLSLPGFEGPLDLLLRLIERKGLAITDVSLVQVADQYLAQVRSHAGVDAAGLADFVAIGARLLLLKSRSLLPRPPSTAEPEPDASELAAALQEYRRYRDSAAAFRSRLDGGCRSFPRMAPPVTVVRVAPHANLPPQRLAALLQQALARAVPEPIVSLPQQLVSVRQKADDLLDAVRVSARVSFLGVAAACASRMEVAVCFLALLHLLADGAIDAVQPEPFGDILLARRT